MIADDSDTHSTIFFALGASCADVRRRIRPRRGVQQVSEKKAG